ncbi:MAG: hydroxyacid dehydrogenase [Alphaproteobacteria bacterium]
MTETVRVLVGGKIHPNGLALLRGAPGVEVDYQESLRSEDLLPALYEADALLVRAQPVSAEMIEKAARLKIISRHGVGYDSVDLATLNARRIPLTIVGDVSSHAVAEHAMMLMLASARRLSQIADNVRAGDWGDRSRFEACELHAKTLLIIGFGRVGQSLATLAQAFAMKILAYDPYLKEVPKGVSENVRLVGQLGEALGEADFVSLHLPGGDKPVLGSEEIARLAPSAIVINTARGDVIDEAALIHALRDKKIAAAGLDVCATEPLAKGHPLLEMKQVILTPHLASLTQEGAKRMAVVSAQNILDFFNGTLNRSLVVNADAIW